MTHVSEGLVPATYYLTLLFLDLDDIETRHSI